MVVSLGPGKFYGNSLPRPRIYTDVKLNSDRVDPPVPVMDPLLYWAQEAHWSMGGLSFKRLHLQGRIEGNVNRLRKFKEKQARLQTSNSPIQPKEKGLDGGNGRKESNKKRIGSVSPPPAPVMGKRRRFMDLFDEEVEFVEKVDGGGKRRPVRKLVGDFDRVAKENEVKDKNGNVGHVVEVQTRGNGGVAADVVEKDVNRKNYEGNKLLKGEKKGKSSGGGAVTRIRTSPRLAKQRSS